MNRNILFFFLIAFLPTGLLAQDWTEHTVSGDFAGATCVFATDLDADGDIDIVGAAGSADEVCWWENVDGNGDGWDEHRIADEVDGAKSVHVADVDGDGDLDVLGAASGAHDILWWENTNGLGTIWTEHIIDDSYGGARCVYAADIDGDGDMDALGAGNQLYDISWWENDDGTGTSWTEHIADWTANDLATSVSAADVDGDGDTDILGTFEITDIWEVGYVVWWENVDGTGTNLTLHQITHTFVKPRSIAPADLDGDGDMDVLGGAVGGAGSEDALDWWENTDGVGGSWSAHVIDSDYLPVEGVHAADVNGDGAIDVLSAQNYSGLVWFENQNGLGTTWTRFDLDPMWTARTSVSTGDMDGDGDIDIIGAGEDTVLWWEHVLPWVEHPVVSDFDDVWAAIAVDVDGDGDDDIVGGNYNNPPTYEGSIRWWENVDGTGTVWTERIIDGNLHAVLTVHGGDVDGDGDLDVLGGYPFDNDILWWENTGGAGMGWVEHVIDGEMPGYSLYAEDVDGDGDMDVLGAGNATSWWENTDGGGILWTEHPMVSDYGGTAVRGADVDNDGDVDIFGAGSGGVVVWLNADGGGTSWTEHLVGDTISGVRSIYAADMDADGDQDLAGVSDVANQVAWWENTDGTGTAWMVHTIDGSFPAAFCLDVSDVDHDGDLDVLVSATVAHTITWWENADGVGLLWDEHLLDDYYRYATAVAATDLDGDGDIDIVGASNYDDRIQWWEQPGSYEPDPVVVTLTPTSATVIPATGGTLAFDATATSNLPGTYPGVWFWTGVKLPNGSFYPQIQYSIRFTLQPYMTVSGSLTQDVPAYAPEGNYEMWGWVGVNPNGSGPHFGGYFPFSKNATVSSGNEVNGWAGDGVFDVEPAITAMKPLPMAFELLPVYPNPFNPAAIVTVAVPMASELEVTVHNVLGQQVAELARGSVDAGTHTFTLDGSNLASGLYFVRASVPGHAVQTQKVVLLR